MEDKDKGKIKEQLDRHQDKAIKKQKERIANDDIDGDDQKLPDEKPKFDRHDPKQMESLKKRDIKRYRKECRKIKREMKERRGEVIIEQPKPIRAPDEIKEIKS
jgi:hypothetical protein